MSNEALGSINEASSKASTENEVLVKVKGVSKKFCRSLKKSLWYGVKDIASELLPIGNRAKRSETDCRRQPEGRGEAESKSEIENSDALRPGEFWAVNNVSFELRRGECLGLIGHNGAGKTTLLKMLNGLIKPDGGRIEMRGRVGALIALGAGFNPILTGRENIYVNGSVLGLSKKEIDEKIDEIIDFAEIREFIDAPVQSYSSGMTVRLGFAIAVKTNPDVLLLDEVLAVGDIGFQAKCFNTLAEFKKQGVSFILVSHNMHLINRYSDRVAYLQRGKIRHLGDTDEGVNLFTRDMDAPDSGTENSNTDWSRVYGSGKVVLRKALFLNEAGEPINYIRPGDTFSLALEYECPSENVTNTVLDIIIRDKEGILFQGTSESYQTDYGVLPPKGTLLTRFCRMPVNGTEISFFVAVLDADSTEVYDWKRNIKLSVAGNPKLTGRLALDAEFTLQ